MGFFLLTLLHHDIGDVRLFPWIDLDSQFCKFKTRLCPPLIYNIVVYFYFYLSF